MKIYEEAQYIEGRYDTGSVQLYDGLSYNQRTIIKTADFYSLSRYISGNKDELGRDKPFFNNVNFRVTLAKTATEFDIKDFVSTSDNAQAWVQTMILNREAYKWMKDTAFSQFLNKFAYVRPKYGGVITKATIKDDDDGKDELYMEVPDWRNLYTDQVDIMGSPIIEKHYMSPLDFYQKKGVWENVDEAIALFAQKRDSKGNEDAPMRLEVWEIHGIFQENMLKDAKGLKDTKTGDDEYSMQKYFILNDEDDSENEMVFYCSDEEESPYDYLAWEEVSGRGLGRGVIEESEEGQVWTNDSVIKLKNTMDIAGRVLIKTDDDSVANNILEVDDGKIFKLEDGKDMTAMQLAPAALGNFNTQISLWEQQMDKATSTYDANTGEQPPSGTPYSQTALLNQVAQRPFAFRQEEAGIFLGMVWNKRIMKHLIKKINKEHLLAEDYSAEELEVIDDSFGNKGQRDVAKELMMNAAQTGDFSQTFTQEDMDAVKAQKIKQAQQSGEKRYLKVPKGFFDDYEGKMTLNLTNEQQNKANILTSLSSIMATVTQSFNPQTGKFMVLEDPTLSKIFGQIIDTAGIGLSPVQLGLGVTKPESVTPPAPAPQATQPPVAPITQ